MFLHAGGDARKLLNIIDLLANSVVSEEIIINDEIVSNTLQQQIAVYDKGGEMHYDIASALIKSIRGSDPNAAVYWLARMVEGGEDVKFIARRLLISAAEDVGLANPNALLLANNCFQAVNVIGMPESRIILSECAIYLANSPKSNSAYLAIKEAQSLVNETGNLPVPLHLRNAPTRLMKDIGYGKNYDYSHTNPGNFSDQEYLPEKISKTKIYEPQENQHEKTFRERLSKIWKNRYDY
jgi:putative ATPase